MDILDKFLPSRGILFWSGKVSVISPVKKRIVKPNPHIMFPAGIDVFPDEVSTAGSARSGKVTYLAIKEGKSIMVPGG